MGYLEVSYVGILSVVPLNQQTYISIPCEDVLLLLSVALCHFGFVSSDLPKIL